jgi:hypothetical protein
VRRDTVNRSAISAFRKPCATSSSISCSRSVKPAALARVDLPVQISAPRRWDGGKNGGPAQLMAEAETVVLRVQHTRGQAGVDSVVSILRDGVQQP